MVGEAIGGAGIGVVWGWLVAQRAAGRRSSMRDVLALLVATGVLIDLGLAALQRGTVVTFSAGALVAYVVYFVVRELMWRQSMRSPANT